MPEFPRRPQTASIAPGNHKDINALRGRLVSPAKPLINFQVFKFSQTASRGVRLHADDDVVEQQELALVRSEEEEFNVDEGQQQIKV